jgi:hypothetical protein
VTGSPYYWAFVGVVTLGFAAVDILALSRRELGRPQGVAVAIYMTAWVVLLGLSLPVAPLGSLWWLFPAALRIAVVVAFAGGQVLAAAVRTEQGIVHPETRVATPPAHKLTEAELRTVEAYDAKWQAEDRERNRERELRERIRHEEQSRPTRPSH